MSLAMQDMLEIQGPTSYNCKLPRAVARSSFKHHQTSNRSDLWRYHCISRQPQASLAMTEVHFKAAAPIPGEGVMSQIEEQPAEASEPSIPPLLG